VGQGPTFEHDERTPLAGGAGSASPASEAALLLWCEYAFLIRNGLSEHLLGQAVGKALRTGMPPHHVLIAEGRLDPSTYLALLQIEIDRDAPVPPRNLGSKPLDGLSLTPAAVGAAARHIRAHGALPLLMSPSQLKWLDEHKNRAARAHFAANGLLERMPEMSAASRFASGQIVLACISIGLPVGGLVVIPDQTIPVLAALLTIPFLLIVALRLLSLATTLSLRPRRRKLRRLPDAELPVYSILVPLFREADALPGLVDSLARLDYPADKLDIMLILEEIDQDTQAAARALALPAQFRIVVVPDLQPRTKPKALNYALELARGAYVVVYDAEDDPEPDQLRRALAEFRRRPHHLMCVQARLAMESHSPGFLERQFKLEYASLFDAMLPAIAKLGLPVALGGTSNHFPRAALDRLGGWDAYNVTEDADLGTRIARLGGRVAVLDSTTWEEPPGKLGVWMRQRTRWLKGFMMTWLVHMRRPVRLLRELGPAGFLGFNAYLGGIVLSALVHPLFVGYLIYASATGQFLELPETALGSALLAIALFNLLFGYISGMALAAVAVLRRGWLFLIPHILLMPLYWLLISAAAYRAALQLVANPYLWEKTPHAARRTAPRPSR
jgi:cellulose synthase/poly-beta-1,6-N-acetylglucosamine synthase-like glycosyltransferase